MVQVIHTLRPDLKLDAASNNRQHRPLSDATNLPSTSTIGDGLSGGVKAATYQPEQSAAGTSDKPSLEQQQQHRYQYRSAYAAGHTRADAEQDHSNPEPQTPSRQTKAVQGHATTAADTADDVHTHAEQRYPSAIVHSKSAARPELTPAAQPSVDAAQSTHDAAVEVSQAIHNLRNLQTHLSTLQAWPYHMASTDADLAAQPFFATAQQVSAMVSAAATAATRAVATALSRPKASVKTSHNSTSQMTERISSRQQHNPAQQLLKHVNGTGAARAVDATTTTTVGAHSNIQEDTVTEMPATALADTEDNNNASTAVPIAEAKPPSVVTFPRLSSATPSPLPGQLPKIHPTPVESAATEAAEDKTAASSHMPDVADTNASLPAAGADVVVMPAAAPREAPVAEATDINSNEAAGTDASTALPLVAPGTGDSRPQLEAGGLPHQQEVTPSAQQGQEQCQQPSVPQPQQAPVVDLLLPPAKSSQNHQQPGHIEQQAPRQQQPTPQQQQAQPKQRQGVHEEPAKVQQQPAVGQTPPGQQQQSDQTHSIPVPDSLQESMQRTLHRIKDPDAAMRQLQSNWLQLQNQLDLHPQTSRYAYASHHNAVTF